MKRLPPYAIFAVCGVLFLAMGMVIITADNDPSVPAAEAPSNVIEPTFTLEPTAMVEVVAPVVEQPAQPLPEQVVPPVDNIVEQPAQALPEQVVPPVNNTVEQPAQPLPEQVVPPVDNVVEQPVQPLPEQVVPPVDNSVEQPAPLPTDAVNAEVPPAEATAQEPVAVLEGAPVAESVAAAGQPTPEIPAQQPTSVYVPPADIQATVVVPAAVVPPPTSAPIVVEPLGTLPPPSNYIPPTVSPLTAQVYGQIITPLRPDSTGVTIVLTLRDGVAQQAVTDSRGIFSFANLPSGEYRIDAGAAGYLSSQLSFVLGDGQALTLPPVTLIGGDTNFDNQIDLSDAALIAANFNVAAATAADLNQDGVVDIRDLTAIGAYFGKSGPVQWQ